MTRDFSLSSLKWIVFSSRKQQSKFLFISKPERIPLGVPVKHRCFMFLKWALEAWLCFSDQGRVQSSTIRGGGFGGNVEVTMGSLGWKKRSSYLKELKILIKKIKKKVKTSSCVVSALIPFKFLTETFSLRKSWGDNWHWHCIPSYLAKWTVPWIGRHRPVWYPTVVDQVYRNQAIE